MKKSAFEQWFVQQFGKRPSPKPLHELYRQVGSAHARYEQLLELSVKVEKWELAHKAARYAYNIREVEDGRDNL